MGAKTLIYKNKSVGKAIIGLLAIIMCGCDTTTSTVAPTPTPIIITTPTSYDVTFTVNMGSSAGISLVKWSTKVTNPDQTNTHMNIIVRAMNAAGVIVAADDKTVSIGPLATVEVTHEFDVPATVGSNIKAMRKDVSFEYED